MDKEMQASIEMVRSMKHAPESPLQAEFAIAEVIICLQERVEELEAEQVELLEQLDALQREKKETQRDWEIRAHQMANVLSDGSSALEAASDDFQTISGGFWQKDWRKSSETPLLAGALRREKAAETTIRQLEAEIEQLNRLWKLLETTLAASLRREKAAETTIRQLEAEIEQLNRLREDDTICFNMTLKFREDKIAGIKALVKGEITSDLYLVEENKALTNEIELLRNRVDRNPEVTCLKLENIRLLDQIRRYQDLYEGGGRGLLINEHMHLLGGKPELEHQLKLATGNQELGDMQAPQLNAHAGSFSTELKKTSEELDRCRSDIAACLDVQVFVLHYSLKPGNLNWEIADLKIKQSSTKYGNDNQSDEEDLNIEEQVLNLQLELNIHRAILEEEKLAHLQTGEKTVELESELDNAKSIIESLESQIILLKELDEVRERYLSKKTDRRRLSLKLSLKKVAGGGKAAKDPLKPKRPPGAFFVFKEFRKTFKEKNPNTTVSVVSKAAGNKWNTLSEAEEAPYKAKANKLKLEYNNKMDAYNKQAELRKKPADVDEEESDKSKPEVIIIEDDEEEVDDDVMMY